MQMRGGGGGEGGADWLAGWLVVVYQSILICHKHRFSTQTIYSILLQPAVVSLGTVIVIYIYIERHGKWERKRKKDQKQEC